MKLNSLITICFNCKVFYEVRNYLQINLQEVKNLLRLARYVKITSASNLFPNLEILPLHYTRSYYVFILWFLSSPLGFKKNPSWLWKKVSGEPGLFFMFYFVFLCLYVYVYVFRLRSWFVSTRRPTDSKKKNRLCISFPNGRRNRLVFTFA